MSRATLAVRAAMGHATHPEADSSHPTDQQIPEFAVLWRDMAWAGCRSKPPGPGFAIPTDELISGTIRFLVPSRISAGPVPWVGGDHQATAPRSRQLRAQSHRSPSSFGQTVHLSPAASAHHPQRPSRVQNEPTGTGMAYPGETDMSLHKPTQGNVDEGDVNLWLLRAIGELRRSGLSTPDEILPALRQIVEATRSTLEHRRDQRE